MHRLAKLVVAAVMVVAGLTALAAPANAATGTFVWVDAGGGPNSVTIADPDDGACYPLKAGTGVLHWIDVKNFTDRTAIVFRGSGSCDSGDWWAVGPYEVMSHYPVTYSASVRFSP